MNEKIREWQGNFSGEGLRIALVVARFNELITKKLLEGAVDCLLRHGVRAADIEVAWVPGAFEIPLVAKELAGSGRFQAVICLGALIRAQPVTLSTWLRKPPRGSPRRPLPLPFR